MLSETLEKLVKPDMTIMDCHRVIRCFELLSELNNVVMGSYYRELLIEILATRPDLPGDEIINMVDKIYYEH